MRGGENEGVRPGVAQKRNENPPYSFILFFYFYSAIIVVVIVLTKISDFKPK